MNFDLDDMISSRSQSVHCSCQGECQGSQSVRACALGTYEYIYICVYIYMYIYIYVYIYILPIDCLCVSAHRVDHYA